MPYGYGNNMDGPASWAAQQQAKQSDDFNQIIRLFLSLQQNQTEQDWKQKEFGAGEKKYANALAQQEYSNKFNERKLEAETGRANQIFSMNRSDKEADNARDDAIARATGTYQAGQLDLGKERNRIAASRPVSGGDPSPGDIAKEYRKAISDAGKAYTASRNATLREKGRELNKALFEKDRPAVEEHYASVLEDLDNQYQDSLDAIKINYGQGGGAGPKADKFKIGERKKDKDGKTYEYVGNDQWRPIN